MFLRGGLQRLKNDCVKHLYVSIRNLRQLKERIPPTEVLEKPPLRPVDLSQVDLVDKTSLASSAHMLGKVRYPRKKHVDGKTVKQDIKERGGHVNVKKIAASNIRTGLPLPTTFAPGVTEEQWRKEHCSFKHDAPLDFSHMSDKEASNYYPYKYYEITLNRSMIGLPKQTKEYIAQLGLTKRCQIVYRRVDPKIADTILKLKELVSIRLVNTIPEITVIPKGYVTESKQY